MLLALLISCAQDPAPEVVVGLAAPHVRTLQSGTVDAVVATGPSVLGVWGGGWNWVFAEGDAEVVDGAPSLPRAAAELSGERFVLADEVRVLRQGEALAVGLGDLLTGAPVDLCSDGGAIWIRTSQGLAVWRGGVVSDVRLDADPVLGPIACGGLLFDERVAWLATGAAVHALAGNAVAWAVFESASFDAEIDAVAVDGQGGAWVVAGGELHHRASTGWEPVGVPDRVLSVLGGPAAGGAWIVTDGGLYWHDGSALTRPTSGPGVATEALGAWKTDGLGRLVVRDADGLHRLAMDRPLWLEAPLDGAFVAEAVEIGVVPTAPEEVQSLTLSVLEADLDLPVVDTVAFLDPAAVPAGRYTLQAVATYAGGSTVVQRSLELRAPGSVTWKDHVQPIHEGSCVVCHAGSTETILDGPGAWQSHIADILINVGSGAMPLGGPPLPPAEVGLIRAWRDGGFR